MYFQKINKYQIKIKCKKGPNNVLVARDYKKRAFPNFS